MYFHFKGLDSSLASHGIAKWHEISTQCAISKYDILVHWLQTC